MSSISADILGLIKNRLDISSPQEILRVASALAANEQIDQLGKAAAFSRPTIAVETSSKPRFLALDGEGNPTETGGWVFDRTTGLVWSRGVLAGEFNFKDAQEACAKMKFRGQACRAPTVRERISITDFDRYSPALDPIFVKESGWEWTATVDASSPQDGAWVVGLGDGGVYRYGQVIRGRVRPVLAGQSFSF